MKIYICHSSDINYKEELYKPLRESNLNKEHEIFLPHEKENELIDTLEIIKNSNLIIAEISKPSTGQGIELGRAEKYNKKIIAIYTKGEKYTSSIKFLTNTIIEYNDQKDMITKLKNYISKQTNLKKPIKTKSK